MKISPLRDPQDFQLETFERFRKVRELKGENIFPALLITSVEQLIIKKCFSFAFEVFFGVLFDVGENLGVQVNEETKLAISEFTVSMQSKRLAVFRELQKKQEFFEVVNGLGRIMMKENDLKTVENAQNVFAELNVDVFICESFWERNSRRTESVYVNLNVLRKGKLFYLMLETEDFMDQEAIEIEENQRIFELNEIERKKREKNQRKEEKRENRRRNEGILMRDEEVYRFQYLKKERALAENEYFSMDSHEFAGRNFIINEMEDYRNFTMVLEKEAKIMIEFQKKEIKKQKNVQRCLNREEKIAKEFFSKNLKKCEKVKRMLEKEEKIGKRVCMYLTEFQERLSRDMQKEEKIVRTIEISTRDTCSASQKHLTFNEKAVKMFNREELRISTSSYESLEQEEKHLKAINNQCFNNKKNFINKISQNEEASNSFIFKESLQLDSWVERMNIEEQLTVKYIKKLENAESSASLIMISEQHLMEIFIEENGKINTFSAKKLIKNEQNTVIKKNEENSDRRKINKILKAQDKHNQNFLNDQIIQMSLLIKNLDKEETLNKIKYKSEIKTSKLQSKVLQNEEKYLKKFKKIEQKNSKFHSKSIEKEEVYQKKFYQLEEEKSKVKVNDLDNEKKNSDDFISAELKNSTFNFKSLISEKKNIRKFLELEGKMSSINSIKLENEENYIKKFYEMQDKISKNLIDVMENERISFNKKIKVQDQSLEIESKALEKEENYMIDFNFHEKEMIEKQVLKLSDKEKDSQQFSLKLNKTKLQEIQILGSLDAFQIKLNQTLSSNQQNSLKALENFEKQFQTYKNSQTSISSESLKQLNSQESETLHFLENQSNFSKSQKNHLKEELNQSKSFIKSSKNHEKSLKASLNSSESLSLCLVESLITVSDSTIKNLLENDSSSRFFQKASKTQESKTIQKLSSLEKFSKDFNSACKDHQSLQIAGLLKEFRFIIKTKKKEIAYSEKETQLLSLEERFARKAEYYQKLESKAELEKKNAEDKYLSALKRIELQKIAEKHRQSKEKQLRMEREVRRKEEQKKYELDAEGQLSPRGSEESPEPPISEESLIHESKIIEAMVLICGSYFCNTCYRMLKRSSLFLKCSDCCSSAFKSSNIKTKSKSEEYTRHKIPAGSVCVGCNNIITRGEIVMCLCCYIRVEFLQDYTPTSCSSCMDAEKVDWVDTYVGSKFELIPCGFCSRLVNYCYVIEICTSCHDQICLHCLRKNHFLGTSVCNECHSRRSVNPYRKLPKSS